MSRLIPTLRIAKADDESAARRNTRRAGYAAAGTGIIGYSAGKVMQEDKKSMGRLMTEWGGEKHRDYARGMKAPYHERSIEGHAPSTYRREYDRIANNVPEGKREYENLLLGRKKVGSPHVVRMVAGRAQEADYHRHSALDSLARGHNDFGPTMRAHHMKTGLEYDRRAAGYKAKAAKYGKLKLAGAGVAVGGLSLSSIAGKRKRKE